MLKLQAPQPLTQITFYGRPIRRTGTKGDTLNTNSWQGQVLDLVRTSEDLDYDYFHNDTTDYPVIQYRNHGGFAAIAGIGTEAVWAVSRFAELFAKAYPEQAAHTVQTTEYYAPQRIAKPQCYQVTPYLFPQAKRKHYTDLSQLWGDVSNIETRIRRNLYELVTKTLGFNWPESLEMRVTGLEQPKGYHTYKRYGLFFEQGIDLQFHCGITLPKLGAIGTGKSKGYGVFG